MITCLKGIPEECFSFNFNVNVILKFLWALRGSSGGTQTLGQSGSRALRVLGHLTTNGTQALGHSDTWALETLYLADSFEVV